jgi:hypothetical protein
VFNGILLEFNGKIIGFTHGLIHGLLTTNNKQKGTFIHQPPTNGTPPEMENLPSNSSVMSQRPARVDDTN